MGMLTDQELTAPSTLLGLLMQEGWYYPDGWQSWHKVLHSGQSK